MFPMLIHDWREVLERRGMIVEESGGELFVQNTLPGQVFTTLKCYFPIFQRFTPRYPLTSRAVYTEVGIVYFDAFQQPDREYATRIALPEDVGPLAKLSHESIYQKLRKNLAA